MKYNVYNKNTYTDVIMTFNADSLTRAIEFASQIKNLDIEKFKKLFTVRESK